MKIRIQDIPSEGTVVCLSLESDWLTKLVSSAGSVDFRAPETQQVSIAATRNGTSVRLRASFQLPLVADCASCLEDFLLPLLVAFDLTLKPQPPQPEPRPLEHELSAPEMEEYFYQGEELDLSEIVREQIILALPLYPRCRSDCRGLCPHCGTNLNTNRCNCQEALCDPRWSALKDLSGK